MAWMQLEWAEFDGLVIHDVANLLAQPYAISDCERQVSPKTLSTVKPRAHGEVDRTRYMGAAVWTLAGYVDDDAISATMDAYEDLEGRMVGSAINGTGKLFRFRRSGKSYIEQCQLVLQGDVQAPQKGYASQVRWAASFKAPEPRIFADTLSGAAYDPSATGEDGIVLPITFPITFGAGGGTAHLELSNGGNADTPPIFTITGPGTPLGIDNDLNGDSIVLQGVTLAAGEQLVIDVARKRVTDSAGDYHPEYVDSSVTTWFELPAGETSLVRLRGVGFVAAQTALSASFRDARW